MLDAGTRVSSPLVDQNIHPLISLLVKPSRLCRVDQEEDVGDGGSSYSMTELVRAGERVMVEVAAAPPLLRLLADRPCDFSTEPFHFFTLY